MLGVGRPEHRPPVSSSKVAFFSARPPRLLGPCPPFCAPPAGTGPGDDTASCWLALASPLVPLSARASGVLGHS